MTADDFAKIAKVNGEITSWKPQTPVDIPLSAFYGYGADVLAVADGRIVQVKDGIPENLPRTDRKINSPVPVTEATVNGNMIALKIGKGQYAYYVHLQPGSIRVKEGDPLAIRRFVRGDRVGARVAPVKRNGPEELRSKQLVGVAEVKRAFGNVHEAIGAVFDRNDCVRRELGAPPLAPGGRRRNQIALAPVIGARVGGPVGISGRIGDRALVRCGVRVGPVLGACGGHVGDTSRGY